jgi:hypothetical protein
MMNWKGFGRKWSWPNFKVLYQHFFGGTKRNHEKLQSGYPVSGSRIEAETSRTRSRSVNHSTTTFSQKTGSFILAAVRT